MPPTLLILLGLGLVRSSLNHFSQSMVILFSLQCTASVSGGIKDLPIIGGVIDTIENLKNVTDSLTQDITHIPTDLQGFASVIRNTVHCLACYSSLDSVCSLNCTVQALYANTLALIEGTGIALNTIEKACAAIKFPFISSFCSNMNGKKCFDALEDVIGDSCRIGM